MKNYLVLGATLLSLSACGGGSGAASAPAASVPAIDPYFALVRVTAGAASDSSEPVMVDTVAATAPEDTEPAALDAAATLPGV